MQDSLHWTMNTVDANATLDKHGLRPGEYFFATIHRAENTDDRNVSSPSCMAWSGSPVTTR